MHSNGKNKNGKLTHAVVVSRIDTREHKSKHIGSDTAVSHRTENKCGIVHVRMEECTLPTCRAGQLSRLPHGMGRGAGPTADGRGAEDG
jgi:hypothetical protein